MSTRSTSPHELGIHGTVDMYRRGECRCEPCTTAFMRNVPHGTLSGSRHHGCSCDECTATRRRCGRAYARKANGKEPEESRSPPRPRQAWAVEEIRAALSTYYSAHGAFPDRKSTECLEGGTWGAAQKWLRGRGLTFRDLLGMNPWREHTRTKYEWSVHAIRAAALEFCERHGRWPTGRDGAAAELGGRTWGRANGWLREQGLTLATLAGDRDAREPGGVAARVRPPVSSSPRVGSASGFSASAPRRERDPVPEKRRP